MTNRWVCYVVDPNGYRIGIVDDMRSFKGKIIFNDVGSWTLEVARASNSLIPLTSPMNGIEIFDTQTNLQFMTGLIDTREQKYDAENDTLTITGFDQNERLNWRLAHPSPTETFPPYTTTAYDVRTGVASTIMCQYVNANLGTTAIGARQMTSLASVDAAFGSSLTGRARWEVLLPFLQNLALQGGDVGFKMVRVGTALQFVTYAPRDLTADVKFSVALGNLIGGAVKTTSPKATYVFAAGTGDLTARVYHESSDGVALAAWGRREYFLDVNNLTADAELKQAGDKTIKEQGPQAEFAVQITDTANQEYGTDYSLGDKVTAIFVGSEPVPNLGIEGGQVSEIIREVAINITDQEQRITPTIGTPNRNDAFRIFREIRRLRAQIQKRQIN